MWFRETVLCLFLGSMAAYMSEFLNLAQSGMKSCSSHQSNCWWKKTGGGYLQKKSKFEPALLLVRMPHCYGMHGEAVGWQETVCLEQQQVDSDFASKTVFRVRGSKGRIQWLQEQWCKAYYFRGLNAASEDRSRREECKYCFSSLNSFTSHDILHAKPSW